MSGRWLHIATTYDVEAKTTTHFLNGEACVKNGFLMTFW